jgi:hypothetical protein
MVDAAYGLRPPVVLNTALFALFAISVLHLRSTRGWRAMCGFTAFRLAQFTEMYGTPADRLPARQLARLPLPRPESHARQRPPAQRPDRLGWSRTAADLPPVVGVAAYCA